MDVDYNFFSNEIDVILETMESKIEVTKEQRKQIVDNMYDKDRFWEDLFIYVRDEIESVTGQELD